MPNKNEIKLDYDIKKIYEQIELELIASMKRNLGSHNAEETLENFDWPQWQALKLKQLRSLREDNKDLFKKQQKQIDRYVYKAIKQQFREGMLRVNKDAINAGFLKKEDSKLGGSFFGINDRKVKALANTVQNDLKDVQIATLRMSRDVYRSTIYKASQMASSGAKTLNQAIDMASKDFLKRGFNCIEYKDGRRINIADYADMAVRTATKRANLMGEGEFRKQLENTFVYVSKHGTSCDKCSKWGGRVYIDDIWSGGTKKDGKYPLLSTAVAGGLFHPRCRHGLSTYFEGVNDEPEELQENEHNQNDTYIQELKRRQKEYERLATGSLFFDNIKSYTNKAQDLQNKIENATIDKNKELTLEECKKVIENQNIQFWEKDLSNVDNRLLSDNTKRLNELINKYPKIKKFIEQRKVGFNALNLPNTTVAQMSSSLDIKNIQISLSKSKYKDYKSLVEGENKELLIKHCMERTEKYATTYSLTHEFGHFIENYFIDEYNQKHLAEFSNMKTRALNAKSISQSKKILRNWESKVTDSIAQEIFEIAQKNNKDFDLSLNLSQYGKKNSFEFFAECFANLECGKPNELGIAMKQFLESRGF